MSTDRVIAVVFAIIGFVLISPVFPYYGVSSKYIFLLLVFVLLAIYVRQGYKANYSALLVVLSLLFLGLLAGLLSNNSYVAYVGLFFISALFLLVFPSQTIILKYVEVSSALVTIMLMGALFSFFYVMLGGAPLGEFSNPDSRVNYVFPFSFTNSYWGALIRPSGIYDEPGAFSFFICAIVTMRELLGLDKGKSILLLVVGMVTLSMAHVVYFVVYLFSSGIKAKMVLFALFALIVMAVAVQVSGLAELINTVFVSRFYFDEDGMLHGDNRTQNMLNALGIIYHNPEVLLYGMSDAVLIEIDQEFGANPLNPVINLGLVGSLSYYVVVVILLTGIFRGAKYFPVFGFGLLLMQRDYIYVVSYSFVVATILVLYFNSFKSSFWGGPRDALSDSRYSKL